jgi:hypothetical protein
MPEYTNYHFYHFDELNKQLFEVYKEHNLLSLGQITENSKYIYNGLNTVMNRKKNINPFSFSPFKMQDEMDFITKDIQYVTAMLFFLQPGINDTEEDGGRYNQTLEDRRYVMYANFGLQAFYNFWDRIGDVLYMYFETGLPEKQAYLGMMLNNVKPEYKASAEYIALKDLYTSKIKPFLGDRHEAVHDYQLETQYYWGAIQYRRKPGESKRLNDEKHALAGKFKEHLLLCIEGFKLTVALLNLLPDDPGVIAALAQAGQTLAPPISALPSPASSPDQQ